MKDNAPLYLPSTKREIESLGWDRPDVIIVTGDAYVDSPYVGAAVIGRVLADAGYRVGIIPQPDSDSNDIARLGEPRLFWGVTAGAVDSLVANYTASGKRRMKDDMTPGGVNDRRPDRATIAYVNLIRRHFKETAPIVIGGIEASLRRVAHYDLKDDAIRRSLLFDAKADILVCGMGERQVLALAEALAEGRDWRGIRGICHAAKDRPEGYVELPSYEAVASDRDAFAGMFRLFALEGMRPKGRGMVQRHGDRYLVHNPPAAPLAPEELDRVHELPYERELHPYYRKGGKVRALDTIRFSITTHRGCFGGCSFCAIAAHQGSGVVSRSEGSIIREAESFTRHPGFRGIVSDVGGPTANMYGMSCAKTARRGACAERGCLVPEPCAGLAVSHRRQIDLLRRLRGIPGMRKVFVASGVRHDLVLADGECGEEYLSELIRHHVSGQLKVAPEHSVDRVLALMGKPPSGTLSAFRALFGRLVKKFRVKRYLTYYLMAAHPGCTPDDMKTLRRHVTRELRLVPEQVQIFTPTPSTWSTLIYWTGRDPATGETIFVERSRAGRERQKRMITG